MCTSCLIMSFKSSAFKDKKSSFEKIRGGVFCSNTLILIVAKPLSWNKFFCFKFSKELACNSVMISKQTSVGIFNSLLKSAESFYKIIFMLYFVKNFCLGMSYLNFWFWWLGFLKIRRQPQFNSIFTKFITNLNKMIVLFQLWAHFVIVFSTADSQSQKYPWHWRFHFEFFWA